MHADMSAEIFEVPAPERINNPIWLAYFGDVNVLVVKWGVKIVKRGVPVLIPFCIGAECDQLRYQRHVGKIPVRMNGFILPLRFAYQKLLHGIVSRRGADFF